MKRSQDQAGRSVRLLRVGEQIRHILADLLMRGDVHDDVLETASITVSAVRVSPDLRHATVYVEPLGGKDEAAVLEALKRHAGFLKGEVGQRLHTKYTPQLRFEIDASFAEGDRIEALLRSDKIRRDLG
jgi:ribosome-binding factor A